VWIKSIARPGSPPRARGARHPRQGLRVVSGITPACAGSTRGSAAARRYRAGSPPRARGARCRQPIPDVARGDHPRVRGEHTRGATRVTIDEGSPPRARGARHTPLVRPPARGITPACAGSTAGPDNPRRAGRDHPRVRGEHPDSSGSTPYTRGSPPRARGAHRRGGDRVRCAGITPACAGSTRQPGTGGMFTRDHPRVRGEHSRGRMGGAARWGSPPRARGAHVLSSVERGSLGITPACAGSTFWT